MRTLNITFTDAEFRKLKMVKDTRYPTQSWHYFILNKCCRGVRLK